MVCCKFVKALFKLSEFQERVGGVALLAEILWELAEVYCEVKVFLRSVEMQCLLNVKLAFSSMFAFP